MNPRKIWTRDPLGDVENAHHIPEDAGMCLLCFGQREIDPDGGGIGRRGKGMRCPLCKGTGIQTPQLVHDYVHGENALNVLQTLA